MTENEFDDRVRSALGSLDENIGRPPTLETALATTLAASAPLARSRPALLVVLVSAVVTVGVVAIAVRRGGETATGDAPPSALYATWQLTTILDDVDAVEVGASNIEWTFVAFETCGDDLGGVPCEDGPRVRGVDGCNRFERTLSVDADFRHAVWGAYWWSTLMECYGQVPEAIRAFMSTPGFGISIEADQIILTNDDGVGLRFVPGDQTPPEASAVLGSVSPTSD